MHLPLPDDSDDEFDWEEVDIPAQPSLEITITPSGKKKDEIKKQRPNYYAERLTRLACHKLHTQCLLANAIIRNRWLNDELLQARLLSLPPLPIHNSFAMIHKSRVPDQTQRGRMFETSVDRLGQMVRALEIRQRKKGLGPDDVLDEETAADILDDDGEVIRNVNSLMKHSLKRSGTRDVSAQLFTALCRALDIPARLVVSIQSVPWKASVGKPKPKYDRKKKKASASQDGDVSAEKSTLTDGQEGEVDTTVESSPSGSMSAKALGKKKSFQDHPRAGSSLLNFRHLQTPLSTPPVIWTEVFSKADGRWLPVDPIRGITGKRTVFDPTPWAITGQVSQFSRAVTKKPLPSQALKDNRMVIVTILRTDELAAASIQEGMPTTISGFKDHSLFVLERHLRQTETIHPPPPATPELGKFKGEPVYPRSSVVTLKTAENWLRSAGRVIKMGEQAMKLVKYKAGTIGRQRELELLKDELRSAGGVAENQPGDNVADGDQVMQGMYAFFQTEPYVPDPVVDGKVPKNSFGNVDLYVPSMLPRGAVHVPYKGTAKIARKLGLDFGEAVTGFEFKKRRAYPVLEGVVVAAENESVLLDAYWEAEHIAQDKARRKREERVLKHWTKLIQGLRVRQRIQDQYGQTVDPNSTFSGMPQEGHEASDSVDPGSGSSQLQRGNHSNLSGPSGGGGGFLVEPSDVIQAYQLPKPTFVDWSVETNTSIRPGRAERDEEESGPVTYHTMDVDDFEVITLPPSSAASTSSALQEPMSLEEYAKTSDSPLAQRRRAAGRASINQPSISPASATPYLRQSSSSKPKKRSGKRKRGRRRAESDEDDTSNSLDTSDEEVIKSTQQLGGAGGDDDGTTNSDNRRSLRPRRQKTQAQMDAEREAELAYRRAIAQ
ncbi:hypothetical protein DL96DRAFT_1717820 [Flagelloscypha sp. PMI_526]|nr:hypothetical protein DL96DRAFT_1717820 [Flagelloscypha sp. PMI_526]